MESWVSNIKEPGLCSVAVGILKGLQTGKRQDEVCVLERSLLAKFQKHVCFLV